MNLKFGTDGIRGPVETHITPEACLKIGHATGLVMKEQGWDTVMIGKDTRVSGYMLESALQAGFIAAGVNVSLCGPLPTPGVAYLTKSLRRKFGVVISASHNNFLDNGIKIFNADGEKLSRELEKKIEKLLETELTPVKTEELGKARRFAHQFPRLSLLQKPVLQLRMRQIRHLRNSSLKSRLHDDCSLPIVGYLRAIRPAKIQPSIWFRHSKLLSPPIRTNIFFRAAINNHRYVLPSLKFGIEQI